MKFRDLKASEIECRVGQVSQQGKGLSLLLYKDARCDARILDETVGADNWECKFYESKGTLFCSVSIRCDRGSELNFAEWVRKDDAGSPSNMEAVKGEASDAFKRACFKWGIGRELYTAPFIWIPSDKCNIVKGKGGKLTSYDTFTVAKIRTEDGKITGLRIVNRKGEVVYSWAAQNGK